MPEFDLVRFSSGMKDVDRDLREMALFDLQQVLKTSGFQFSETDTGIIMDLVLRCFSKDEPDKEVRNAAVQVIPQLLLLCSERQQIKLCSFLCTSATSQTAGFGERGYSDILDSSAFALKLCCELMEEKSRVSVEIWQRLGSIAQYINSLLISKLQENTEDVVKESIYDSINTLIKPFGRFYSCEVRDIMSKCALSDFSNVKRVRRQAITCLGLLSPLLSEEAFNNVRLVVFGGLKKNTSNTGLLPFLQLYDFLVRNSPVRVAMDAITTMNILLKEIEIRTVDYDSDSDDVCDSIMKLINSMVVQYPNELLVLHSTLFDRCLSLINFDPNYCSDNKDNSCNNNDGDGEEEEDENEDYYIEFEEVDVSWRIRVWSLKIISSLIQFSSISSELIQKLKPSHFFNLNDRIEDVQITFIQIINTIAQYLEPLKGSLVLFEILDRLLICTHSSNQKVALMAIRSLQILFSLYGDILINNPDKLFRHLKDLMLQCTNDRILMRFEVVILSHYVTEFASKKSANIPLIIDLLQTILNVICTSEFEKFNDQIVQTAKALTYIAQIAGNPYPERCITLLFSLLDTKPLDVEISRHAIEAIGFCFPKVYLLLSDKYVQNCLERLIYLAESNINVAQVLNLVVEQSVGVKISSDLLEHLCGYLVKHGFSHQRLIVCVIRDFIKNGSNITDESLNLVIRFLEFYVVSSKDSLLVHSTFELLNEICKYRVEVSNRIFVEVFPSLWRILQTGYIYCGSLYARIVGTVSLILHSLYIQLPQQRCTLVQLILDHISSSVVPEITCDLLNEIAVEDETLLEKVSNFFWDKEPLALLCAGTIGRYQLLPDIWKTNLINILASGGSEKLHRIGLLANGRAASNPLNVSLLLTLVERAVTEKNDRYLYWKAIKEATINAASNFSLSLPSSSPLLLSSSLSSSSSLRNPNFCKDIEKRLLENALEEDPESTALVLGSFAPFNCDELFEMTSSYLDNDSDLIKAVCISTQRYLILHYKGESCTDQIFSIITKSLQCLNRTMGVQVRLAALHLFATIISSKPSFLLTPIIRDMVYPNLLAELIEDPSLILSINLGGFTHREDKGIEIRKLAFQCLSILLRDTKRQRIGDILEYYGQSEKLLQSLVHGSGPQEKGEVDGSLNNQAKTLLVQLVKLCPKLPWSDSLIVLLYEKLKSALEVKIESTASDVEKKRMDMKYTLNCVMHLTEYLPFVYNSKFHSLFLLALHSPLLAESMKLVI
ncbi:uncharacterized protein TM35_000052080 [Trypanosoma theileri]|uniref:TATA-binding protein interacting (TIP20) domain-containing protein n=1 Tax=Trypanosoma theileri TaxID=67003 RepID=A0A1X0P3V8_9TRYP|nr:uncharacterized protein TM35_000052080 [Trypanosoma theileri]ORC91612.1 hypothetical protein TM35_000052080 [Trypanosoma theileri]